MQNHLLLSIFCPLLPNLRSVSVVGGGAAFYRTTDLLIHSVKRKIICPLRAIMLAECRNIHAVFILNISLKNSCYPELWLHQRTLFKMWQTLSSNLYGDFVCKASHRKAVLFKMSYKNAAVIVFSWVTSLGEDNWDKVKKSCLRPIFPAWWSAQLSLGFDSTLWPTALFCLLLFGALICSFYARVTYLSWISSVPGKSALPELSPHCPSCLASCELGSVTSVLHIILPDPTFTATWKPWGTSSLPCYFFLCYPNSYKMLLTREAYFHSPLWRKPVHSCTLCLASGTSHHQKEL